MKRLSPKKRIVGAGAWIKRTAESKWERVGFLFGSRLEASTWARAEYPNAVGISARRIRAVLAPKVPGASWADHAGAKA